METSKITDCPICSCFPNPNTPKNLLSNFNDSVRKCPVCGMNCGRPALLDMFCGGGGAARGYQKAGFCVLGVDIKPQPHYAGCRFVQADALTYPLEGFDAYHASPPCQMWMDTNANGKKDIGHTNAITPIRIRLLETLKPYVIENVYKAPLNATLMLCGTMFDLRVIRHRYFETSFPSPFAPYSCNHWGTVSKGEFVGCYGRGGKGPRHGKGIREPRPKQSGITKSNALDINWMDDKGLNQAIPPAYTEFIGKYLMQELLRNK